MAVRAARAPLRRLKQGVAAPDRHSQRAGLDQYLARAILVVIVGAAVVGCASDGGSNRVRQSFRRLPSVLAGRDI